MAKKPINDQIFDLKKDINAMLVGNQRDTMDIERHVRILYSPARQPKENLQRALKQIDMIHKSRSTKQTKLRKALDQLYLLYSQSPTLEIPSELIA